MPDRVLIVESGIYASQTLARFFEEREDEVWQAWKLDEAASLLDLIQPDLMLLDIHFPGDDWLNFLSRSQEKYPALKIILTTKLIDLRREMLAKQHGIDVFVRQPFTHFWLEQALNRVEQPRPETRPSVSQPAIRFTLRLKIILPFALLVLFLILLGYFVNYRLLEQNVINLTSSQLQRGAVQTTHWLAALEDNMLGSSHQLTTSPDLARDLMERDKNALGELIRPVLEKNGADGVEVLDWQGNQIYSWYRAGEIPAAKDETFPWIQQRAVQMALKGMADRKGDQYIFLHKRSFDYFIYVCSPLYDEAHQARGVLLVGRSLAELAKNINNSLLLDVSFYDRDGIFLASSLLGYEGVRIPDDKILSMIQSPAAFSYQRPVNEGIVNRQELLIPWQVREGETIGFAGISLAEPEISLNMPVLWQTGLILLIVVALALVWLVGHKIALQIIEPIQKLTDSMAEVNSGNLITKVETDGHDELSNLTRMFNGMVLGFQQKLIYRDLMGYMPSTSTVEKMRQTLNSADFSLRGHPFEVSLLIADIHHFTEISRVMSPEFLIEALNEYFAPLIQIASALDGIVYQVDNDSLMLVFGVLPEIISPEEGALRACRAAVDMNARIEEFNQKLTRQGFQPFYTGMGIHSGVIVLGGLSIRDQIHYTPVGNTIKIAHYLDAIGLKAGLQQGICISQDTFDLLGDHQNEFEVDCLGQFMLKPDNRVSFVYQLISSRKKTA
ncbi:MAG: HAMP domain-containing protein [Anaerolineae bacterium]|nr:HAMP domain-containing protein [Anaerolineae bacterium]